MNGYIKKEDAEQELQHFCDDMLHHFEMNLFAERARVKDCIAIIRKVPSVDVVEVVRCKDCKNYMTIHCTCDGCCISDEWYCADGERKEQENE